MKAMIYAVLLSAAILLINGCLPVAASSSNPKDDRYAIDHNYPYYDLLPRVKNEQAIKK